MKHLCSMLNAGPNGHIVIVHTPPHEFADSERAAWRLLSVSHMLGGMDVLLRYAMEDGPPLIEGDPQLCHHGEDSRVDALPVFELRESRRLQAVA
jgi:hypothetical protein